MNENENLGEGYRHWKLKQACTNLKLDPTGSYKITQLQDVIELILETCVLLFS